MNMITTMFARTIHLSSRRINFHHSSISLSHSIRCKSNSPAHLHRRQMSTETESIVDRLKSSGLWRTKGLIGGKWIDAYDGKTIEVNNPASGDVIASVACMGEKETKDAISSAYDAFSHWSMLTANDRSSRMRN